MLPNSKSPKPYSIHEQNGRYYFLTDYDLLYACRFDNLTPFIPHMVGIYNIEISDFSFAP